MYGGRPLEALCRGGRKTGCLRSAPPFLPFCFAIANNEPEATYRALFQALQHAASILTGLDLARVVAQYHCDWHAGEAAAVREAYPHANRCGDYAHLVGATTRPKTQSHTLDATTFAWRSGIFSTARKHLRNKGLVDVIANWLAVLRSVPTAAIFHLIARVMFQVLATDFGERLCVGHIQKHYFTRIAPADARRIFHLQSWDNAVVYATNDHTAPRESDFLWSADWWCGIQRDQPGSAGGSQAQESWHRHKLKAFVRTMRQALDVFVRCLARFTSVRLRQLRLSSELLPDTPGEPFPDTHLCHGPALLRRGRTVSEIYAQRNAFVTFTAADGTLYYALRRTLATYERDAAPPWHMSPASDTPPLARGSRGATSSIPRSRVQRRHGRCIAGLWHRGPF